MATKVVDILKKMDLFERLPEPELLKISKLLKEKRFRDNEVIVRQGDVGDSMYILTDGRVKVAITDQFGREKVLAFFGEGQTFGDMALLTGAPRSADVVATTPVRALQLRKDDFDVLLAGNIEVMKEMMRAMASRQANINQRVSEEASAGVGRARGQVTVVYSPRGGAGKSVIAANLAIGLAQESPDRVCLVDLDLMFGQQTVMLNLSPRTSLAQVTPSALRSLDRESFAYYLSTHEESSLRVLVGAMRPEEGEMITADHVRIAVDLLKRQFVHVVVDSSGGFGDATLAMLEAADEVVVVLPPELMALRDARECQRIFFDLLGFPRERFQYVVNCLNPYGGVPVEQVELALAAKLLVEIPFGGVAPSVSQLDGNPLVVKWPNNPASKGIAALTAHVERKAKEALALASR